MQVIEIYILGLYHCYKHVEGISDSCCRVDDYADGAK